MEESQVRAVMTRLELNSLEIQSDAWDFSQIFDSQ